MIKIDKNTGNNIIIYQLSEDIPSGYTVLQFQDKLTVDSYFINKENSSTTSRYLEFILTDLESTEISVGQGNMIISISDNLNDFENITKIKSLQYTCYDNTQSHNEIHVFDGGDIKYKVFKDE